MLQKSLLALVIIVTVGCSPSSFINIKTKDFTRFENLTIRTETYTTGPFEKIPKKVINNIETDIKNNRCSKNLSIEINSDNKVSYSC